MNPRPEEHEPDSKALAAARPRRVVVLAGGRGTRLSPLTDTTNKHLLDVAGRPMIAWVLDRAARAGLTEACVVTNADQIDVFRACLGEARSHGLNTLNYLAQSNVGGGVADALAAAEPFIVGNGQPPIDDRFVCLLGDNLLADERALTGFVERFHAQPTGTARLLLGRVGPPMQVHAMGIARFKPELETLTGIDEKPIDAPQDALAVLGVYGYPNTVFDDLKNITPGPRNEREISELNRGVIASGRVHHETLDTDWIDAGTHECLAAAASLLQR